MFYLGIDQHARQLTISLRDEQGDVVQARQVSTQPDVGETCTSGLGLAPESDSRPPSHGGRLDSHSPDGLPRIIR